MTVTCDECSNDADPEKVKNLVRPGTDDEERYRLCVWCQPKYPQDRQYTPATLEETENKEVTDNE